MDRLIAAAFAATATFATSAYAQEIDYPADSVRLVVPANPGGGTDVNARIFADFFNQSTDAEMAVVNQFAGGGVVAFQTLATGPTDGSQLMLYHSALHVANLSGMSPFGYQDFTPLATTAAFDDVVLAAPDAPYDSLSELVEYAKANPGEIRLGSQLGGTTQVKGEAINEAAEGNLRVVDAGSESDRIVALLGGQIDAMPAGVASAQQYVEAGQAKVLGVLTEDGTPFEPDWPSAAEQGIDISFPLEFTIYGPAELDPAAVEAMDAVMARMKEDPAAQEAFTTAQQRPSMRNSDETQQFLEDEVEFVRRFFE